MKVKPLLLAAILAVASCRGAAHRPSVGLMATPPPSGRVIGFDPSVVGLPGAIGDTVYDSAGIISWVKYDTANTAWRPVPVSQFVTGDPSLDPGLKAPIGFVVTKNDGSASWIKSTTSDTGWVTNPGGGGIPDGGVQNPDAVAITGGTISGVTIQGFTPTQLTNDIGWTDLAWQRKAWTDTKIVAPGATQLKEVPILFINAGQGIGTLVTGDGNCKGTCYDVSGSVRGFTPTVFTNLSSGTWAVTCEGTIPALSGSTNAQCGVANSAGGGGVGRQYAIVGAIGAGTGGSTTNFIAQISNDNGTNDTGTCTITLGAFDANTHRWTIGDNGTTVTVTQDGVQTGSTATRTCLPGALNMAASYFENAGGVFKLYRLAYAF